jgi:hypothetical protein
VGGSPKGFPLGVLQGCLDALAFPALVDPPVHDAARCSILLKFSRLFIILTCVRSSLRFCFRDN